MQWEEAYTEGRLARLAGEPFLSCPYPKGELKAFWQAGWMDEDTILRYG